METSTLTDLFNRRKPASSGGNPNRFIELVGGKAVPAICYEPDAETSRFPYYYNSRLNKLFKKMKVQKANSKIITYYWLQVSEC